jgi:hypothetical protein
VPDVLVVVTRFRVFVLARTATNCIINNIVMLYLDAGCIRLFLASKDCLS